VLSAARAEPERVRSLDLYVEWRDRGLSAPPEDLATFVNLEHLCLWGMTISDLPEGIVECRKLVSLDIRGGASRPFPPRVFELRRLRELYAGDNQYRRSVPDRFDELAELEVLELGDCGLATLPASIARCQKLRRLAVPNNELTALPPELAKLARLEELDADGNDVARPPWLDELKELRLHYWVER
jgi:Leucine-rich repeat (LRR) protein